MTPERWKQISLIYDGALTRAVGERVAFLTEACAGDTSLQREVQALLDQPTSPKGLEDLTPAAIAQAMGEATGVSMTGRRFGVYVVHERIGVGGMGEVYRARDTSLGRDVAIKVLTQAFATDAERLARFEREARILASLDHPHIGTIHGIEDSDGVRAIVLALVEGETLAERIVRAPIPMGEALEYARQIADALEAAHDKGIVHRDLKPANIKITPAGVVKVLDFGLAKTVEASSSEALTRPANATGTGVVMGTLAYMSPEQARGHAVDKRADIWAFGCVLYEMLTGRDAFAGGTPSDTIAAILERDAHVQALPATTPSSIERLLKRCFEKDPRRRLRDIGEARVEIDDAQRAPALQDSPRPTRRWLVATLLSAVVVIAAAAVLVWTRDRVPPASAGSATRFFVGVTPADMFGPGPKPTNPIFPYPTRTDVALSPDGTLLVFSGRKDGRQQLYLHPLNRLDATPIAGTDNSNSPFFSPDGQWLGFWTGAVEPGAIGELKKVRLDGSPAVTLAKVAPLRGATWRSNDIVFAMVEGEGRLWRVPAAGGMPEPLTRLDSKDGDRRHSLPQMLPDGRGVLYTIGSPRSNFADGQIAVTSLATGDTHVVLAQGVDARYVSSGHLVYVRDGTLMAVAFDLKGLRVTGTPVAIVKDVMQAVRAGSLSLSETGAAQFSVSDTGALVYVRGVTAPEFLNSLVWVSRDGAVTPTKAPTGSWGGPRFSPDGQRVVLSSLSRGTVIHDLARGGLVPVASGIWPTFTPDGKQITLTEPSGFVSMSIEGGKTDHFAIEGPLAAHPAGSWSPDGQTLLFTKFVANGAWEIRALSRTGGDRKVHPAGNTLSNERHPQFSPDGEWFVYSSSEPGEQEGVVYVERYRGAAERHPITTNGGTAPAWAPNGRELFYLTAAPGDRIRMMAVDITLSPAFKAGIPHVLFEGHYNPGSPHRHYDVSRDGRFLMLQQQETPTPPPVTQMVLVLNWFEELKRLAPSVAIAR